jgi:hypothetical protein
VGPLFELAGDRLMSPIVSEDPVSPGVVGGVGVCAMAEGAAPPQPDKQKQQHGNDVFHLVSPDLGNFMEYQHSIVITFLTEFP